MSLDATVLEERRRRVRDRVRRHRQRKKLREEGLPEDEIARQLTAMESFRPPTNTVRRRRQPRPATDHTLVADGDLGMSQYLVPAFLSPAQNMPIPGCESMGYEMAFNTFANEMAADGLIAGGCVDFEYIDSLAWDPSQFGAILRNLRLGDISGNFRKHSADGQQLMALPSDIMGEIVPDAGRQTFLSAVDSLKCISEGR
ncbi:Uncharacterized protein PBTT_05960 [Plasmodiophora brassicae]